MPRISSALMFATLLGAALSAQGQTVGEALRLKPGDARARAQIAKLPGVPQELREVIAERFDWAMVDLDGDGHRELLVLARDSGFCGSAGCSLSVYRVTPGPVRQLLGGMASGPLAVTRESYGGLRGIVQLDEHGAVARGGDGRPLLFRAGEERRQGTAPAPAAIAAPAGSERAPVGSLPDVLGLQPGKTDPAKAQALLQALQPAQEMLPHRVQLTFDSPGRGAVKVADGEYLERLEYGQQCGAAKVPACERVDATFAAPPRRVLVEVRRLGKFPEVDAAGYEQSLVAKYGPPGLREQLRDGTVTLNWAWDAHGRPMAAIGRGSPCRIAAGGQGGNPRNAAGAGCAARVSARFYVRNALVSRVDVSADAPIALVQAAADTQQMVSAQAEAFNRQRRDAAARNAPVAN